MGATAGGRDRGDCASAGDARGHRGGRVRDRWLARRPDRAREQVRDRGNSRASSPFYAPGADCTAPSSLVGSLTRPRREFIDAFPGDCQHRTSFPFRLFGGGNGLGTGMCAEGHDGSHRKTKFLGCSRIDPDGGPCHLAIRREHALPRTDRAGWDAIHFGLRNWAAHAG